MKNAIIEIGLNDDEAETLYLKKITNGNRNKIKWYEQMS